MFQEYQEYQEFQEYQGFAIGVQLRSLTGAFSACSNLKFSIYGNIKYLGNKNNPYLAAIEPTNNNLASIELHENTKLIADGAFFRCSQLTSIEIPDSVISIGNSAFLGNNSLTSVVIGNGVTRIGNEAFAYCDNLASVVIGNSVTRIGDEAFAYCNRMTSIEIPDTVTSIGRAFSGCSNLRSITFKGTVAQWNAVEKHPNWNYNLPGTEVVCKDGKA